MYYMLDKVKIVVSNKNGCGANLTRMQKNYDKFKELYKVYKIYNLYSIYE